MIEEITWETFDERTRVWMQVLSNVPVEAVVRMLRLDLNTGVVTLRGVGGDKVLGVISTDDDGLIDVNLLDRDGYGLYFHLAYGNPDVQEAHDRAVLFLNNRIEKNKKERKENHVG